MVKRTSRDVALSQTISLACLCLATSFQHKTFHAPVRNVRVGERNSIFQSSQTPFTSRKNDNTHHPLYMSHCLVSPRYNKISHSKSNSSRFSNIFNSASRVIRDAIQINNPADRVTLVGSLVNIALSTAKFAVGVRCHSTALVSDGVHSLSDLLSDFITLVTVRLGRLPPTKSNPDGFGKYEAYGTFVLALAIISTGISVGFGAFTKILQMVQTGRVGLSSSLAAASTPPGVGALVVAFLSVVSKEWLFRITKKVGEDINSSIIIANAKHHRSDAFSSVVAMGSIGIAMSIPGMRIADVIAGLFVAGMIFTMGVEIMASAVSLLKEQKRKREEVKSEELIEFTEQYGSAENLVLSRSIVREEASFDYHEFISEEKRANIRALQQKKSREQPADCFVANSNNPLSQVKVSNRNLHSDKLKLSLLLGPTSSFNVYDNKLSQRVETGYSSPIIPSEEKIQVLSDMIMMDLIQSPQEIK
eukprot:CAMPEP_0194407838 /NCGR_PEP_ID=MMETSP0176-20130528/5803_1 /TAXON_ID=216777 /ORGANISM="Proboscia alata, Strain PI-D3" /LENGTH=474 /DNA_ID=CAMNT_0039207661 /DNA_START=47 /DNA_END=1471 /DNA_ORIENTATION=-